MRLTKFFGWMLPLVLVWTASAADGQTTIGVAPSDGLTMLVKRFSVPTGTTIVGAQFQNNDPRTIFPEVMLVRGVAAAISEGTVVTRVTNVSETTPGTVTLAWPQAMQVSQSDNYYLAVRMPAGSGKQGPGNGPA